MYGYMYVLCILYVYICIYVRMCKYSSSLQADPLSVDPFLQQHPDRCNGSGGGVHVEYRVRNRNLEGSEGGRPSYFISHSTV